MANITFVIPDNMVDAVVDAFCAQEGYQDMVWENDVLVSNPETKIQFTRRTLKGIMKTAYVNQQSLAAKLATEAVANGEL
jgi:predicted SAM-dependent methyltransferase